MMAAFFTALFVLHPCRSIASIYPGDRRYERYQTRAIKRCVGIWEHAQLGYCWRAEK